MIKNAYIFRYRSCNTDNFDSIKKDYLWFSPLSILNDPFDGSVDCVWDRNDDHLLLKEVKDNFPGLLHYGEDVLQKSLDLSNPNYTYKDPLMISCFSRKFDNILMWSHYAKCHTGFCEVFKCTEIKTNIIGLEINKKSFYKSSEKLLLKKKYIPLVSVIYNNKKIEPLLSSKTNTFDGIQKRIKCYFQKSKDWEYEQEHRAVVYEDTLVDKNKLYYPKESLVSIIMGSEINGNDFKEVYDICKDKQISLAKMKKVYN